MVAAVHASFTNVEDIKSGFSSNSKIQRQIQPGVVPLGTTAILVEFGVNGELLAFEMPIDWN